MIKMSAFKPIITRHQVECPMFGAPCELNQMILPTVEDVLKFYLFIRYELKYENSGKEPTVFIVSQKVAQNVEDIWIKASIPIVSRDRVLQLIRSYHNKYLALIRYPKVKRNVNYDLKLSVFKNESKTKLFDIASCKCQSFSSCSCHKLKKVPIKEQHFLQDQRTTRKMVIGTIDSIETSKLKKREERKQSELIKISKYKSACADPENIEYNESKSSSSSSTEQEMLTFDQNCEPSTSEHYICSRNKLELKTFARVCDQYSLSDRSAAAIASAVLQDVGLVTKEDCTNIIDKNKVRRARHRNRIELRNELQNKACGVKSLYFDGRKDKTLYQDKKKQYHRRTITEEHVSLIEEPGSSYLGHITPLSGSAKSIADSILDFFNKNKLSLDQLMAIGCDGTVVNTGCKNGVISYLESKLNHPLQWFICQLHANELLLRHLFQYLDGATRGPNEYSGAIGKSLEECEQLPVVNFKTNFCDLPELDFSDLSSDQRYLYEICQAISSGQCSENLANRNPGKLSNARWLTTANRILRFFIGCVNPSLNLKILVEFIIRVYVPMWFTIKCNPSCKNGTWNVFKTIQLSRYLSDELKSVIDPVIQRNAYFSHPENMLLGMISDDRQHIRELGLRRILKAREICEKTRVFKIPKLNFSATDYFELIYWKECQFVSPPIVDNFSNDDLNSFISCPDTSALQFDPFPSHTQAVERCVKVVTEASMSVIGSEARDGFIRVKIKSRQIMPCFQNKKQYKIV